jgi:hypothetical protein
MAVKKPIKKRDATSPNTALVLFLVFFVLLSIGLGVWGYYGYAGQKKLREDAAEKDKGKDAAVLGQKYFQMLNRELVYMLGHPLEGDDVKARDDAREMLDKNIEIMNGKDPKAELEGEFKAEATFRTMLKMFSEDDAALGYKRDTKRYAKTYRERLQELATANADLAGKLAAAQKSHKDLEGQYAQLAPKMDKFFEKANDDIEKANAEARKIAAQQPEKMDAALKALKELQKRYEDMEEEFRQKLTKAEAEKKSLRDQLVEAKEKAAIGTPVAAAQAKAMADPHALMLDISAAKPLWDEPLGKVLRVDLREQQVYINLGSAKGVRPQLTFNIFGAGWYGRADKGMKGTIEVVRVLDANSSLARLTALYDSDGYEIPLNDPNLVRRQGTNAIGEGDLLFNMAWGTHIVVAGAINWTGLPGDAANDQARHLQAFISLMERMGVTVDAYIDLNDGNLRGKISSKTRYMVRGDNLPVDKDGQPEANKKINEAIQAVRKEAIERGMFIISADNFALVTGYRRPRSATETEVSSFRPAAPYAGLSAPPPGAAADQKPPPEKN